MVQIGYSLIDSDNTEIQFWDGEFLPSAFKLPNGDHVCGVVLGPIGSYQVVPRMLVEGPEGTSFDGTNIVVSRPVIVTADDVRAEAQRRIISLVGVTSLDACIIKQLNALMRATELTNKRASGIELSPEETAESAALQAMADSIKAIRAASNVMEPSPPSDYTDDSHWE